MVLYYRNLVSKVQASLTWPSVQGKILHSELIENNNIFLPKIQYQYTIGSHTYTSNKIHFGFIGGSPEWARTTVSQNSKGKGITVFYNPDNPGEACLERKVQRPYFYYIFGVIFLFLGLVAALVAIFADLTQFGGGEPPSIT